MSDVLMHKEESLNKRKANKAAETCHDAIEKLINYLNGFLCMPIKHILELTTLSLRQNQQKFLI